MLISILYIVLIILILFIAKRFEILSILHGKKNIKCKRSGMCCRYHVKITKKDIERLKDHGIDNHLEIVKDKTYIKRINGYCPYLSIDKGIGSCTVHDVQPDLCRRWPKTKIWGMKANDCRCRRFKEGIYKFI